MADVLLPWPPRSLPTVCVKTGRPTTTTLVITPRGSGLLRRGPVHGRVRLPLSPAALARWHRLHRVRLGASGIALVALLALAVVPVLTATAVLAVLASAVALVAFHEEVGARFDARVVRLTAGGDQLLLTHVHAAFAAATEQTACAPSGCAGCGGACALAGTALAAAP